MAQNKNFMSRISLKRDTEAIWHNQAKNFVPLDGEVILYKPDNEHNYYRYKIGDGTTTIINLPFQLDYGKVEQEFKPIQGIVSSPETSDAYADAFIDTIIQDRYGKITATKKKVGNAKITITPGTKLTTGGDFTTNQSTDETITLNHATTTRSNTTNSEAVSHGGSFNVIDTITSDTTGHITAVNTKTVTLPAAVDISGKMDKENPTGTGSFSLNRKANTTIGNFSFAEGNNTTASGNYSHAEGRNTTASGSYSHAEGSSTFARGVYSHAEGYNTDATGESSHAEGDKTQANGAHSHAEGSGNGEGTTEDTVILAASYPDFLTETVRLHSTRADGTNAHAEGYRTYAYGNNTHSEGMETIAFGKNSHAENQQTVASGNNSHAEGFKTSAEAQGSHTEGAGTRAIGDYQHVQGKYNVVNSDLAHIVGNGTSKALTSNAHTIDWQGNAWFAGDVYVDSTSGTNKDAGSKKLATEDYISTNYKSKQTAVSDPTASGSASAFIDSISQDANGKITVTKKNLSLPSILKFIGTTTTALTDGATTNPITIGGNSVTAVSGNVVILSGTDKEFLWTGSAWEEFGNASGHSIVGHTHPVSVSGSVSEFVGTITKGKPEINVTVGTHPGITISPTTDSVLGSATTFTGSSSMDSNVVTGATTKYLGIGAVALNTDTVTEVTGNTDIVATKTVFGTATSASKITSSNVTAAGAKTDGTAISIPQHTFADVGASKINSWSAGSSTNVSADDITAWSAGTMSVSGETLTLTLPSLTYTAVTASKVTVPSLSYSAVTASKATAGTAISVPQHTHAANVTASKITGNTSITVPVISSNAEVTASKITTTNVTVATSVKTQPTLTAYTATATGRIAYITSVSTGKVGITTTVTADTNDKVNALTNVSASTNSPSVTAALASDVVTAVGTKTKTVTLSGTTGASTN